MAEAGGGRNRCDRPLLAKAPPIWSVTRQELCETLPYYRTYHSGCYFVSAQRPRWFDVHEPKGGDESFLDDAEKVKGKGCSRRKSAQHRDATPYAYLLGGYGAPRDVWHAEGRVVISHGGGKSGRREETDLLSEEEEEQGEQQEEEEKKRTNKADKVAEERKRKSDKPASSPGRLKLLSDQTSSDARVAALLQSVRDKTPIILILGKDYPLAHFRLRDEASFAILGWYYITDAWAERADDDADDDDVEGAEVREAAIRYKFRFE